MTDLDKLIEAVEAGEYTDGMFCPIFHASGHCVNMEAAYLASLDAAKALHDALVPGWRLRVQFGGVAAYAAVTKKDDKYEAVNPCPARAWLLAILKAYRPKQDAT